MDEDAQKHGGWWRTTKFEDIIGSVAIQFGKQTYIKSLDNGLFTLGPPHNEGIKPWFQYSHRLQQLKLHYSDWNELFFLYFVSDKNDEGDGPEPEEIFTALAINDRHIALKSGYGRYLKVEKDGIITGRSEAVGGLEQFEPVFQVNIFSV